MIDVHCHILPGVDDGPETLDESLDMVREAINQGVTAAVATPHHKHTKYENVKQDIIKHVEELNEAIIRAGLEFTVLPGQEIRLYGELLSDLETGDLLTINNTNKYLFIELPSNHVPRYTDRMLYQLQLDGFTPVIVHPERNSEFVENPSLLYQLVKKGAITQVTASSITGEFGKKIKKFALSLLDSNQAHVIGSDSHNTTNRKNCLKQAYHVIEREFGSDSVCLLQENAICLVNGQVIHREQPSRIKQKKFLGLFG